MPAEQNCANTCCITVTHRLLTRVHAFVCGCVGAHLHVTAATQEDEEANTALAALPRRRFGDLDRTSHFLKHPIFNKFHSETELMRYCKHLEVCLFVCPSASLWTSALPSSAPFWRLP